MSSARMPIGSNSSGDVTNGSALKFFPGNYSLALAYAPVTFSKEVDSSTGDVTYKLAVGVGRKDLLDSKSTWNQFKSSVEDVAKQRTRFDVASAFAQGKSFRIVTSEGFKAKPKLGLVGYGEFTYGKDGRLVSKAGRVVTEAMWKAHADWQFWTPVGPVYLQLKGGADVKGSGGVSFDAASSEVTPDFALNLAPSIGLEGGYGFASVATIGVEGCAAVPIQVAPLPTKGEFEAKASVHAYLVFVIDWSHDLAQFRCQLWPKQDGAKALTAQAEGAGSLKEADRGYAEGTTEWSGGVGLSAQGEGLGGFVTLQESVMPQTIPLMAEAGGRRVMVFHQDDPSRDSLNSSRLAYSVLGEGGWGEPRPVWDTDTLDAYADLKAVGDELWVVWQKERSKVKGDLSADADGVMRSLATGSEICAARFDPESGAFVDAGYVTDNDCLDMMPALVESATSPLVAFVRDASGSLDQSSDTRQVVLATYEGGSWREEILKEEPGRVGQLAAGMSGGQAEVAYTTIGGGAGGSRAAGTVRVARTGTELAGGDEQPTGLQWEAGRLWWTSDGLVRTWDPATGEVATLNPGIQEGTGEGGYSQAQPASVGDAMQVLSGARGTTVLWTQTDAEACESGVCSAVVGEGGSLSGQVDLREDGFGIAASSAIAEPGGGYSLVANTFDASGVHDLAYTTIGGAGTLEAQGASAYAEEDGTVMVTYGFTNNSEVAVSGYVVTVRRGDEVVARREVDEEVAPGACASGELAVEGAGIDGDDELSVEATTLSGPQAPAEAKAEVTSEEELDALAEGPAQITSVEVSGGPYAFDGRAKRPAVAVRAGEAAVPEGGYRLTYRNNVGAGTATVVAEGVGSYGGSASATFRIAPAAVTSVSVMQAGCVYDGAAKRPAVAVRAGSLAVPGSCYDLSYANNVGAGTATVTVTGKGNYAGTARATFPIAKASMSAASIFAIPAQTATGRELTPKPTVKVGGTTLREGTDYALSYANNVNVGTATVTDTGKGNYAGSKSATFRIEAPKAAPAAQPADSQPAQPSAPASSQPSWQRLWGQGALDTAAAVVRAGGAFADGRGGTVVVATSDGYWDALAASGLAGTLDAPVVITAPGSLSPQAAAEIRRLRPARALVMGGSLAVSDACLAQVRSLVPDTRRVFGQAATDTAVEIYRAGSGWGRTAVVATSGGYWDALSVAPYAWARRAPIFLTGGDNRLGASALSAIRAGGFSRVVIVGGSLAVSSDVERQLSGIAVTRLWGQGALDTSAAIARWELSEGMSLQSMGVATADGYWDALAGAALCGKGNSVLVLVLGSDCRAFDAVYDRSKVRQGWVFGGEMAVSKAAWDHVTAR